MRFVATETPYVRIVAADSHAVARAFARAMVGEPVAEGSVLIGVDGVYQTEELPDMGLSTMTNLEIWRRMLRSLGIPPHRCTPVYSFQIGLPNNIRESKHRLPEDVSEPEIVGFTFRFTHKRRPQTADPAPWKHYKRPRKIRLNPDPKMT